MFIHFPAAGRALPLNIVIWANILIYAFPCIGKQVIVHEHVFIVDVDGNRFEIPSVEALDRASYKKIELYL